MLCCAQIYDTAPLDLAVTLPLLGATAALHTSAVVPPLLAAFYAVLGSLFPLADAAAPGAATAAAATRCRDPWVIALGVGCLAAGLQLSASLFQAGTPYATISVALALVSAAIWKGFDGTPQGAGLAAFCAVGAPASELVLLHFLPLWHYTQPDILGGAFVSWVPWCYFFYTPVLGAWARYLWAAPWVQEAEQPGRAGGDK